MNRFVRRLAALAGLTCCATLSALGQGDSSQPMPAAPPSYRIADLGRALYSADDMTPFVDASGTAVIWNRDRSGHIRPLLTQGAHGVEPPPLPRYPDTYVADINADGVMVGMCKQPDDARYARAFLYSKGRMSDLGTLGGDYARAYAVRVQVAGAADTADQHIHAFRSDAHPGARLRDLGTLPGGDYSSARGINARGQVVGVANVTPNGVNHAFLWDGERMRDLGLLSAGTFSHAQAINDAGQVVGWANTHGETHAVLWKDGSPQDLGAELSDTSSAWSINNRGQIVGTAAAGGLHKQMHACLWEEGKATDLNTIVPAEAGRRLQFAYRINDMGQIMAVGTLHGAIHAYLLTPIRSGR